MPYGRQLQSCTAPERDCRPRHSLRRAFTGMTTRSPRPVHLRADKFYMPHCLLSTYLNVVMLVFKCALAGSFPHEFGAGMRVLLLCWFAPLELE